MDATKATARVEVVIELPAQGTWGPGCTLDQVFTQAGRETCTKLGQVLRAEFGPSAKIVGEPKVQAVITQ